MKSQRLSRSYLETLSSAQLISIADEYGIDIPDDLNRQFIIGDLLELMEELDESSARKETLIISDRDDSDDVSELPSTYNETKIDLVMQNPVSLFVWWDVSEAEMKKLHAAKSELGLQVCFYGSEADDVPADSFDVQISLSDRERYVLIPGGKDFVSVSLIQQVNPSKSVLVSASRKIRIPHGSKDIMSARPGKELELSGLMRLSGIQDLLRTHYNHHRQSFY